MECDAESRVDASQKVPSLRDCLRPETTKEPSELKAWLASQTRWQDDSSILYLWSKHSAARISSVTNYKEQVIL